MGGISIKTRKIGVSDFDKNVIIESRRKNLNYKKGWFFVVNQEKVQEMIKNKKYTGETLRLLLFFMSVVEYDNRIKAYTQTQIAEKISMRQPQISRAIKDLESDRIIIKDGRDFYFSTEFLTKGTFNNRIYEAEVDDELDELSVDISKSVTKRHVVTK